jgi:hypothetical protein
VSGKSLYKGGEEQVGAKSELQACARTRRRYGNVDRAAFNLHAFCDFAIFCAARVSSNKKPTWVLLSTFVSSHQALLRLTAIDGASAYMSAMISCLNQGYCASDL